MCPLIDHGQQPMKMHTDVTLLYKKNINQFWKSNYFSEYYSLTIILKRPSCILVVNFEAFFIPLVMCWVFFVVYFFCFSCIFLFLPFWACYCFHGLRYVVVDVIVVVVGSLVVVVVGGGGGLVVGGGGGGLVVVIFVFAQTRVQGFFFFFKVVVVSVVFA